MVLSIAMMMSRARPKILGHDARQHPGRPNPAAIIDDLLLYVCTLHYYVQYL